MDNFLEWGSKAQAAIVLGGFHRANRTGYSCLGQLLKGSSAGRGRKSSGGNCPGVNL